MGYPESDRKQLFYQWIANESPLINYRLYVYTNGLWWDTYIRDNWPRELNQNDQGIIYNMLAEQTGLNWRTYDIVEL